MIDTCAHKHGHDGDLFGIGCDDDDHDEKIAVSFVYFSSQSVQYPAAAFSVVK